MSYVAYVHAKPEAKDTSDIFYVGKGLPHRAKKVVREDSSNRHYKHTVAKYGAENILVGMIPCSSETIAFDLERGLIKCLRRMGVALTNMTDGGEGSSGYITPNETRGRISKTIKSLWENSSYREKVIESRTNSQAMHEVSAKKLAASLNNAVKARLVLATEKKEVAAKKNSEMSLKQWRDPDFRASTVAAQKAVWTEEKRAEKGADTRGRKRMTNGTEERNVREAEVEALSLAGWSLGRKPRKSSKRTKIK
jgi:hypothetical protein